MDVTPWHMDIIFYIEKQKLYQYRMDVTEASNVTYAPGELKKLSSHVEVCYLKPYVGELYSQNNCIEFIDGKDGCMSGDLVTWTKKCLGTDHLTKDGHVRVKLSEDTELAKGDQFECVTKSPFLVNNRIKFIIIVCKKTGSKEVEVGYCDGAARLLGLI